MGDGTHASGWKRWLLKVVEARLAWVRQQLDERTDGLPPDAPYPDYVTCPHCATPEVEVWSDVRTACCHECGRSFAYAR